MRRLATTDQGFAAAFETLLNEPTNATAHLVQEVAAIIATVRAGGDAALRELTLKFDRADLPPDRLRIAPDEIEAAMGGVPIGLLDALNFAAERIEAFHRAQIPADIQQVEPSGIATGLRWAALDSVGVYVPGGKAAYPSSVLMNALPARIAGVRRVAMCVPSPDGVLNPLVLAAARRAGVSEIYRVGGAQAIAALAWGTETIAPVDRIVGPGNAYVAEAKRQVFGRVGIDSVAGPSEVVILADNTSDPRHIAIDLLAQAEHDEAARAILITDSPQLAASTMAAVYAELPTLPRSATASASWRAHGAIIQVRNWDEGAALSDRIAPEHLQIMVRDPVALFSRIRHAGAVFLGPHCPEAVGDYVAGPNHVLPTGRTARFASGLSVFDFLKRTTWVVADAAGLAHVGPAAIALAEAEGLQAHARSIALRLGKTPQS